MGQFTFETQGTNTYLVYNVGEDELVDSMSLGMITNNKIPGLAPTIFTQLDTSKFVKFNVSAKISVNQFFSGPVNKKRLLGVFQGIVDAMLSAEDYMIDPNSIMLDLNYIFADVSTCETVLVCLPIVKDSLDKPVDLGTFFKNIMFGTQFDQTENCDHVAKIMNYLNSAPVFSLSVFKEVLESISGDFAPVATPVQAVPVAQPVTAPVQAAPVAQPVTAPVQAAPVAQPVATPVQTAPVAKPMATPAQTTPVTPVAVPAQAPTEKKKAFAIPGKGNKATQEAPAQAQPAGEKPMSMMYLLQHYSKENAALYKAQKEAAKNGGAAPSTAPAQTQSPKVAQAKPATAFAIPGQAAPAVAQTQPAKATAQEKPATAFAIPGQAAPAVNVAPAQQRPVAQPAATPVHTTPAMAPAVPPVVPQSAGIPMNFGETTVLGGAGIGETTVLGAVSQEAKITPHLIRSKNSEKININKPVFRIGKEKSYVDYFIADNTAISRSHANIIEKDGAYFVVDTNSTNHTYVNEAMIQSNVEVKLEHGSKVRLANENFEFRLY